MAGNDVKVSDVVVARKVVAGLTAPQKQLEISVAIENKTSAPRFAWSTVRRVAYDKASKVLTVHLEETAPVLPPGLIMLSDHPRTPQQTEIAPGAMATLKVAIPAFIRRAAPDGNGWVEDPIGQINHIDVRLQHSTEAIEAVKPHETGEEFRARALRGSVISTARIANSAKAAPGKSESN